jgi:GMP synthase (glutamine-hydrolysing) A subunit
MNNNKQTIFIFWGQGTEGCGRDSLQSLFKEKTDFRVKQWTTFNFLDSSRGGIKRGDILLFPGGSASQCFQNLCEKNLMNAETVRNKIKSYIIDGINYIGICAGSYLARTLRLIDYNGSSSGMGNSGNVDLSIDETYSIPNGGMQIIYNQGPLFFNKIPGYKVIAKFNSVSLNNFTGENKNKYIGSPAIIHKPIIYGNGGILLFSPHFEFNNQSGTAHEQFLKIINTCFCRDKKLVLIIDFGSSHLKKIVTLLEKIDGDLIIKIIHWNDFASMGSNSNLIGVILSGSPAHLYDSDAPQISSKIFSLGVPILGICYGMQMLSLLLGCFVVQMEHGESGDYSIQLLKKSDLFLGLEDVITVKMRHQDQVINISNFFKVVARSDSCVAAMECVISENRVHVYCLQFHPELDPNGAGRVILNNFLNKCKNLVA